MASPRGRSLPSLLPRPSWPVCRGRSLPSLLPRPSTSLRRRWYSLLVSMAWYQRRLSDDRTASATTIKRDTSTVDERLMLTLSSVLEQAEAKSSSITEYRLDEASAAKSARRRSSLNTKCPQTASTRRVYSGRIVTATCAGVKRTSNDTKP